MFKKHEREKRLKFQSPYVFLTKEGSLIDLDNLRNRVWYPTLERERIRRRVMKNTRHTFAALMLSSGENIHWVAKMMGHTSIQALIKHYSRWIPNLTHRDGSAFLAEWEKPAPVWTRYGYQKETRDYASYVTP